MREATPTGATPKGMAPVVLKRFLQEGGSRVRAGPSPLR